MVAVASKVAVGDPAGTFTETGTVSAAPLAETATLTPPAGAGAERVTVQTEDAPASRLVELQVSAEISMGAIRLKVAVWEEPLRLAVIVAV